MDSIPCIPPKKKPGFDIAFDFHDVITDKIEAIRRAAKTRFNISLPPQHTKRRSATEEDGLRPSQFKELTSLAVASPENMHEIPYALEVMSNLRADGHFVEIVTASSLKATISILQWLMAQNYEIPVRTIGRNATKEIIAQHYDIAIDDDVEQAEAYLRGGTPYVYLLDRQTNLNLVISPKIKRIPGLYTFQEEVRELYKRHYPSL